MCRVCTSVVEGFSQIVLGNERSFTYDYLLDMNATQSEVYDLCVYPLVEGCLRGYNATVFAYGQTGSGKTYTMGSGMDAMTDAETGIIPRAVADLFQFIDKIKLAGTDPVFKVEAQFVEIYNDTVLDLLDTDKKQDKPPIQIHEDQSGNICMRNVTVVPVNSAEDTLSVLRNGILYRSTASTDMNTQSSRSHALFSLLIRQRKLVNCKDGATDQAMSEIDCPEVEYLNAKFHFVDLAGSERLKRTGGHRIRETISINYGLLALGNVISTLGNGAVAAAHVPYRDSKLTRLLQDSLGGNSKTLMIACVSPSDCDFVETLNTLKYANRARNIKNKVTINRDRSSAIINELKARIRYLEKQLLDFQQNKRTIGDDGSEVETDLQKENVFLQNEVGKLQFRLKALQSTVDTMKDRNLELKMVAELRRSEARSENAVSPEMSSLRNYLEEIESLRTKLSESEFMCRALTKRLSYFQEKAEGSWAFKDTSSPVLFNEDRAPDAVIHSFEASSSLPNICADNGAVKFSDSFSNSFHAISEATGNQELEENEDQLNDIQCEIYKKEHLIENLENSQIWLQALCKRYQEKLAVLERNMRSRDWKNDRSSNREKPQLQDSYMKSLKSEVKRLRIAQAEHQKLLKRQAENKMRIEKLQAQLQEMKKVKVELLRKIRCDASKLRAVEKQRMMEVNTLQREASRKDRKIQQLENEKERRDQVLKRKHEELASLRRLKLANENSAKSDRGASKPVGAQKANSPETVENIWKVLQENIRQVVSRKSATVLMEKQLERLFAKREELRQQLQELQSLRAHHDDGHRASDSAVDSHIDSIKHSIDYLHETIADCQREIMDIETDLQDNGLIDTVFSKCKSRDEVGHLIARFHKYAINQGIVIADKNAIIKKLSTKLNSALKEQHLQEQLLLEVINADPENQDACDAPVESWNKYSEEEWLSKSGDAGPVESNSRNKARSCKFTQESLLFPDHTTVDCEVPLTANGSCLVNGTSAAVVSLDSSKEISDLVAITSVAVDDFPLNVTHRLVAPSFLDGRGKSASLLLEQPARSTASSSSLIFSDESSSSRSASDLEHQPRSPEKDAPSRLKAKISPFLCCYKANGHDGPVLAVHVSNSVAATGSTDKTVKIWDLEKLVCVRSMNCHHEAVSSVLFGETQESLYEVSGEFVNVWDLRSFRRTKILCSNGLACDVSNANPLLQCSSPSPDSMIKQIDMSPCGRYLFTLSNSQIRIWDLRSFFAVGKMVSSPDGANTEFCSFRSCSSLGSGFGCQVVVGCKGRGVKRYSLPETGLCDVFEPELSFELFHKDDVASFAESRGCLFSAGNDKQIVKWNVMTGHCIQQTTSAHRSAISALDVMWHPYDVVLLSACRGGYVKLWNSDSCDFLASVQVHSEPINCMCSSVDGFVFTASSDKSLKILRLNPEIISSGDE